MATEERHPSRVWERLRRNREQNTPVFTEAGIRPELVGKVICPGCGAEEHVLFWSMLGRKGMKLRLLCPICEDARVGFNLADNRPVDPVFTRGTVGGGLGMLAVLTGLFLLFWFRDTPTVQMLTEDVRELRGTLASGASQAADRLPGTSGQASASRSATRGGGSARPSGGSVSPSPTTGGPSPGGPRGSGGGSPSSGGAGASGPTLPARPALGGASAAAQPLAAGAAGETGALVYRSRGDRREDVDHYTALVIDRAGSGEAGLVRGVEYDAERDETLVVIDAASAEWPRRLTWLRGWRRLP